MDSNTELAGGKLISVFGGSNEGLGSNRKIIQGQFHLKSQADRLNVIPQDGGVKMTKFRQQRKALASANIYKGRKAEYENILNSDDNEESRSQAHISTEVPAFFKMSSIAGNSTKMRPFSRPTGAVSAKAANFGLAGI